MILFGADLVFGAPRSEGQWDGEKVLSVSSSLKKMPGSTANSAVNTCWTWNKLGGVREERL